MRFVAFRANTKRIVFIAVFRKSIMTNEVLIIGAGPSGLFAAAEFIRHGLNVRLIERESQCHREARATTIQAGTLEILDSVGLLPAFMKASEHVRCSRIYDSDMTELRSTNYQGLDCRCDFECVLPQYETQRILEEHLKSLGGSVERAVTATKLELDADGVLVELAHSGGRVETLQTFVVIGAGGAHSVTRDSMTELLEGATYQGHFLVADIAMEGPLRRDESGVICGPEGLLLLAPMPGGRWISFQDLEENAPELTAEDVIQRVERRLGSRCRPTDVAWFSPFRMHRRIVSRFTDGRRFLIGDAAHLSSPFGGEGLNSGLHDSYDLAWKVALVLHGHARRSLLEDYAMERLIADRHVLDVSDQVHSGIVSIAEAVRQQRRVSPGVTDPFADALVRNARAMIDIDYKGSPLVADYTEPGAITADPHPGQRYPDWIRFGGTTHHLLVFGPVGDAESLTRVEQRWSSRVDVSRDPKVNPARAGIPNGGLVLIRPDGHIGFRATSTDTAALEVLEGHLGSYLV
jgi:6-methylpretetramide 4-monooxygenase / 4-hydroxy-6-methylpretetramide 12a-monooxygenase